MTLLILCATSHCRLLNKKDLILRGIPDNLRLTLTAKLTLIYQGSKLLEKAARQAALQEKKQEEEEQFQLR